MVSMPETIRESLNKMVVVIRGLLLPMRGLLMSDFILSTELNREHSFCNAKAKSTTKNRISTDDNKTL